MIRKIETSIHPICHFNDKTAACDAIKFVEINFKQKGGTPSCTSENVQNISDSLQLII